MENFLTELFSPQNLIAAVAAAWLLIRYLATEFVASKRDEQEFQQGQESRKLQAYQIYTEQLNEAVLEILRDNQDNLRTNLANKLEEIISNQRLQNTEISNQRTILNHLWRRVEQLRDDITSDESSP